MDKKFKKKFEKKVYLPLRKEMTLSGSLFLLIGIVILIVEHLTNSKLTAIAIISIAIGLIFFFRRHLFDRGFSCEGDPVNRYILNITLQGRANRLKKFQKIHYNLKRAEKIRIIEEWLEES
jgi:hypothetical protein